MVLKTFPHQNSVCTSYFPNLTPSTSYYPSITVVEMKFLLLYLKLFAFFQPSYFHIHFRFHCFQRLRILYFFLRSKNPLGFFIVAPCILKSIQFTHQQMHYFLTRLKALNCYIKMHNNNAPTCFGL